MTVKFLFNIYFRLTAGQINGPKIVWIGTVPYIPYKSQIQDPRQNYLSCFEVNFICIKMLRRCLKKLELHFEQQTNHLHKNATPMGEEVRNGITTLHSEQETTEQARDLFPYL